MYSPPPSHSGWNFAAVGGLERILPNPKASRSLRVAARRHAPARSWSPSRYCRTAKAPAGVVQAVESQSDIRQPQVKGGAPFSPWGDVVVDARPRVAPLVALKVHICGPDRIRTGDLVLDRDVC